VKRIEKEVLGNSKKALLTWSPRTAIVGGEKKFHMVIQGWPPPWDGDMKRVSERKGIVRKRLERRRMRFRSMRVLFSETSKSVNPPNQRCIQPEYHPKPGRLVRCRTACRAARRPDEQGVEKHLGTS